MNRPIKFGATHPVAQYAATKLRDLGYVCHFSNSYQEWLITGEHAAALDRNIAKAMKSLLAKLLHRGHKDEWAEVRKILLQMELDR